MTAEGDMLMSCIGPCSNPDDNDSCNNDCLKQTKNGGFCYPKLDDNSNEKDCCCYL